MNANLDPRGIANNVVAPYRELTMPAVILGILQGIILNISFVYAALKLGFSIGGSTVAAIMGYVFLRGILKNGSCVENNINQTIASGINTAGTGVVFTLPALFMLGIDFEVFPLLLGGIAGAFLGVVLIVPLRKQMIELDRLRFPTGVAVTAIIRSGSSGFSKAKLLGIGFLVSGLWKLLMVSGLVEIEGIISEEELNLSFGVIPEYFAPYFYLSLMNIGAGMLAGRGGLPFFIGGILAWWVISPMAVSLGWVPGSEGELSGFIYGKMLRPLGIGCLIGGALMGVILSYPAIKSALSSLVFASKTAKLQKGDREEMPLSMIVGGLAFGFLLLVIAAYSTSGISIGHAVLSGVAGTLWLGVAGLIVAQSTGLTDISPMSGMALISVTVMMFLLNGNVAGAMVVGVAVSVAIGQAADMMQDLKTGFMLGANPFKQQLVQFCTVWFGVLLSIGAVYVLWSNGPGGQGGFGEGTSLPAPQAGALSGIIAAVQGGNIPLDKYLMGGIVGALLGAAPMAGLGVLIGLAMYLPFSITFGYGAGCLITMYLNKKHGGDYYEHKIVPIAAGFIVGEAIMGVGHSTYEIILSTFGG